MGWCAPRSIKVGIVLVSHSATLAQGVRELIQQMAADAPIALAAGTDNADEPIGTDPMRVHAAIQSVYSEDGVLVLMDLGSAIMSAEAAIEFLDEAQQAHIYLCEAPLVEGGLAAAVAAAGNAPLAQVVAEARAALPGKLAQLEPVLRMQPDAAAPPAIPTQAPSDAALTLTMPNRLGLHARPAARLVALVRDFDASVTLTKGERTINAGSISQVMTLGARRGDTLRFTASGEQSDAVLAAIQALHDDNFGDVDEAPPAAVAAAQPENVGDAAQVRGQLAGIPVSGGIAVGKAHVQARRVPRVERRIIRNIDAEQARLSAALLSAHAALAVLEQRLAAEIPAGRNEADIFTAQQLLLSDEALTQRALDRIDAEQINAEWAWQQAVDALVAEYSAVADDYLRARAEDVRDVGDRVLRQLADEDDVAGAKITLREPGILVVAQLAPSAAAALDPAVVLGLIIASGGATGHAAIIARSLGIPVVMGVAAAMQQIEQGQPIALDGSTGQVWTELDEALASRPVERREAWLAPRKASQASAQQPAVTRDGRRVEVAANIGSADEVAAAVAAGAEGVGLFRTEFLFMERTAPPDEESQYQAYRAAAEALGGRPLLIRTLDVGGDKPLPYLDLPSEENPFLGWRGIRYSLDNPKLFRTQLRAILRAGHGHRVQLMFPMVSTVAEVRRARAMLDAERQSLADATIEHATQLAVGIMVETPAAVLNAHRLAMEVDFFSIGTNDLTQYLMAADRGNTRVAGLIDALQPPVVAAMAQVIEAAHEAGIWVGLCGELAGDVLSTPLLVGLGIDELSMSAPSIAAVKAAIRGTDATQARQLADDVLACGDVAAVREMLRAFGA